MSASSEFTQLFAPRLRGCANPVSVREIRQMVRNKLVATGLIVYLFAQLAAVMIAVFIQKSGSPIYLGDSPAGTGMGHGVATIVNIVMSVIMLAGIPLFTGIRMTLERNAGDMDLQFATSLRPAQFVDGKTVSALILLLLFASATLPFFMLAYILRGVDVFITILSVCATLAASLLLTQICIGIGSQNQNRAFRVVLMILALTFLCPGAFGFGTMLLLEEMRSGSSADIPWWMYVLVTAIAATLFMMMRAVATAQLTPPHANGQRPLRVTLAIAWLVWGVVAAIVSFVKNEPVILSWFIPMTTILHFMLYGAVSSPSGYSRRVLSEIKPHSRNWQFLTFTGAESGIMFAIILLLLTLFGGCSVYSATYHHSSDESIAIFTSFVCYPAAHYISARILWQAVLKRHMNCKYIGLVGLIWMVFGSILAAFVFGDSSSSGGFAAFSAIWFIFAAIFHQPFVSAAFDRFQPPTQP